MLAKGTLREHKKIRNFRPNGSCLCATGKFTKQMRTTAHCSTLSNISCAQVAVNKFIERHRKAFEIICHHLLQ